MNLDRPISSTDVEQVERPVASRILATLIEASPLAIVAFDPEGVVTMWNPAAERIFGWSEKEAVGMGLPFVPAEKQEEFRALRQRAMRGEVFTEPELYRRRADGSPIVVSVSTSPLRRPDGTIHGIMSILMDVTERKAAEESRARLSMAVEQAGESIIVTDTSGAIRYVNPAFERITGYDRTEVVGRNPRFLKSGRHDAAFYRNMWETIGRGEVWRGTFFNRRKDGTLYEEDAVISPVRDPSGQVVNYVGVKRDVTDVRRMEERLRQSQKMEAVGRLAGGVAHDFNNLLTAISGYSDLLLHRLPAYSTLRRDVEEIRRAGDRAAGLTRQLLAFSRRQVLQPRILDLNTRSPSKVRSAGVFESLLTTSTEHFSPRRNSSRSLMILVTSGSRACSWGSVGNMITVSKILPRRVPRVSAVKGLSR